MHHKLHLKDHPELALDDNNLEGICAACHNDEHPEKYEKFKANSVPKWNDERW